LGSRAWPSSAGCKADPKAGYEVWSAVYDEPGNPIIDLAQLTDLRSGIAELARVLRPGGDLALSVLHPFQAFLGWHAPFTDPSGRRRFVREHAYGHGEYLEAFRAAGLGLGHCLEPPITAAEVRAKRRAYTHIPEAATEAYAGLPGVLVMSARRI
jgi:SAM-dependent methyltransferase